MSDGIDMMNGQVLMSFFLELGRSGFELIDRDPESSWIRTNLYTAYSIDGGLALRKEDARRWCDHASLLGMT